MNNIDKIIQALSQHMAYEYRAATGAVKKLNSIFTKQTDAMLFHLLSKLTGLSDIERQALIAGKYTTKSLREVRSMFDAWQTDMGKAVSGEFDKQLLDFANQESSYIAKLMRGAGIDLKVVAGSSVIKSAAARPVTGGRLISELLSDMDDNTRSLIINVTRQGIADGWTNDQIIQRLRGTGAGNFSDGLLNSSKIALERNVRTIRNHISNTAYLEAYRESGATMVQFVSILDSRTSKQCASLDGHRWAMDEPHPVPPMHPNCRSSLIGLYEDEELDGYREQDSYPTWFSKQSEAFQQEWLGPSRYKLYKDGKYTIDRFVDPQTGKQYTLAELQEKDEQTFKDIFGE